MIDLHKYLTNPFDDPRISMDELVAFAPDHLARLNANNPAGVFAARITATTAALNAVENAYTDDKTKLALRKSQNQMKGTFRNTLPAAIGKIHGAVESEFGAQSAEMTECFPKGRVIFAKCTDGDLAEELQTLINGLTNHQPQLGAQAAAATALLTAWSAIVATSGTSTGAKSTTQSAKNAARAALQLELFKNLLTLALNFPGQPEQLDVYMQPSLLQPHTPSLAAPAPTPAPSPGT